MGHRRYALTDPDEEARRKLLIEQALSENLGMAGVPKLPLSAGDRTTPRMTDRAYPPANDTWSQAEPTKEELEADLAEEEAADTPAAVDKRAASVPEEQKGTPAAPMAVNMGWADKLLNSVKSRMLDAKPLSTQDYSHASEQFIDPSTQKGQRTDLLGFDDEEGFSREKQIARAREAYGDDTPPSRRLEEEFLRGRERLTDAQIRRRAAVMEVFGSQGQAQHWAATQHANNRDYDAQLANARAGDRANTRIDRGLAEAIAATGNISPEEAGQLTYGNPLVKAFSSGMYSQGGRAEGQALGLNKHKLDIISKLRQHIDNGDMKSAQAELSALTQLSVAELNRQGRQGAPIADPTTDQNELRLRASVLNKSLSYALTPKQAAAAVQGDMSGIPPDLVKQIEQKLPGIMATLDDPKTRGRVLGSSTTQDVTAPDKMQYAIQQSLEVARNKPAERMKFKNDWDTAKSQFTSAWTAWNSLSHKDRELFSQVAGSGWSKDARAAYLEMFGTEPSKDVLDKYSAVQGAINALVKERSGSAVTGSEWERIASELGIEADNWGPFNSSGAITNWLKRSGDLLIQHRKNFSSEYAGWEAGYAR